jgi:hypothetical protein
LTDYWKNKHYEWTCILFFFRSWFSFIFFFHILWIEKEI